MHRHLRLGNVLMTVELEPLDDDDNAATLNLLGVQLRAGRCGCWRVALCALNGVLGLGWLGTDCVPKS